ncbi:GFA family protein [soil metagenome]
MHSGSCLCGDITFTVAVSLARPDACHCRQCRKQTGHYFASTDVPKAAVTITGQDKLVWFASSEKIRRGFCATCGSTLFWEPLHRDWMAVAMGAFDEPTETSLRMHIFVADKGDYYAIDDGLPQRP